MPAQAGVSGEEVGRRRRDWLPVLALLAGLAAACAAGRPEPAVPPTAPPPAPASDEAAGAAPVPFTDWPDSVLYFAIVDRFADGDPDNNVAVKRAAKGAFHGGDLDGLRAQLDEIAELGATALWITPVVRNIDGFVTGAGFPDWAYHGYWADDFERLDPRFGTEDDLRALVDAAHRRGIRVLLDVVYNHAGYGTRYLSDPATRGWLRSPDTGTCGGDDLTQCVAGLPDFRTELPGVAHFLMNAHLGLAQRVGLDGLRLDTVKHVAHPFWQNHRQRTRSELGEGFFLLGEVWGGDAQVLDPWFAGDEMDAGFDFSFSGSALGWVQGRGRTVAFDRYLQSRHKVRAGRLLAHFLSSHDVPGALHQLGGDKQLFRLALVLQMTTLGLPVVYYGEEVGRPGGDWPENRSDMPWGERRILPGAGQPRDEALRADTRALIAVRRAHPALSRGSHAALSTAGDLLVFLRRDEASGDAVVVAVNRGATPAEARFAAPSEWAAGRPRVLWPAGEAVAAEGEAVVAVPARAAVVLGMDQH